jgi:ubiquinone/menaquinone biosynthesis C-methylase UbiE
MDAPMPMFEQRRLPLAARLYLWATYRLYAELAFAYDAAAFIVSLGRWDRWRRMALDYVPEGPVLEVGFGTGELLLEMARRGWDAMGVDPSPAMHRVTAAKMRRRRLWAPRLQGTAQSLPFPEQSFGAVVCTFPAEYIGDPATLQEFRRVLRQPDGRLIIAGLVVFLDQPAASRLSRAVFGGTAERPLQRFEEFAASAGLAARTEVRADPPWQVPVIIAGPVDHGSTG